MKFEITESKDTTRQRVEVRAVILDAEPRPVPYSRQGRQWRPSTICVTWARSRNGDGEWSAWSLGTSDATVAGPEIKKDGSDSLNTYAARWLRENDAEWGEWIASTKPGPKDGA